MFVGAALVAAPAAALPWDDVMSAFPNAGHASAYLADVTIKAAAPLSRVGTNAGRVPVFLSGTSHDGRRSVELALCDDYTCKTAQPVRVPVRRPDEPREATMVWAYPANGYVSFTTPDDVSPHPAQLSVQVSRLHNRHLVGTYGEPMPAIPSATWAKRDGERSVHQLEGGFEVVDATDVLRELPELVWQFDAIVLGAYGRRGKSCQPLLGAETGAECGDLDAELARYVDAGGVVVRSPDDRDEIDGPTVALRPPSDVVLVDRADAAVLDEREGSPVVGRAARRGAGSVVFPTGLKSTDYAAALLAAAPRLTHNVGTNQDVRGEPAAAAVAVAAARRVPAGTLALALLFVGGGAVLVLVRRRREPTRALVRLLRASIATTLLVLVIGMTDPGATARVHTWTFVGDSEVARHVVADAWRRGTTDGSTPRVPDAARRIHGGDGEGRGDVVVHTRVMSLATPGRLRIDADRLAVTNDLPIDLEGGWLFDSRGQISAVGPIPRGGTGHAHAMTIAALPGPEVFGPAGARLLHELRSRSERPWYARPAGGIALFAVGKNDAGEWVGVEVRAP